MKLSANNQKKILIVSYNPLSKEGANGRTLEFLVGAYDADHIAQLYFSGETPDISVCNHYYEVGENQLLKSIMKGTKAGSRVSDAVNRRSGSNSSQEERIGKVARYAKKNKRSVWVKLFRNMLWKIGKNKWQTQEFDEWIQEFSPDAILTISGKSSCFHDIAVNLSEKYNLPLIIYHCEDYCLKSTQGCSLIYKLYIRRLKKSVTKMMNCASLVIYNSKKIKQIYEEYFHAPSLVAYMSTDMISFKEKPSKPHDSPLIFTYMGNLGLNRYRSLYEIAQTLKKVATQAVLNIYAPSVPEGFSHLLETSNNMFYKGFVPYSECRKIIEESDILVHAESFDEKTRSDLRIAFSTKIADSLASGIPLFVYAPSGIASTDYLIETNSACVVTNPNDLCSKLSEFLGNESIRQTYVETAQRIAKKNHSFTETTKMIAEAIESVVETQRENHGED